MWEKFHRLNRGMDHDHRLRGLVQLGVLDSLGFRVPMLTPTVCSIHLGRWQRVNGLQHPEGVLELVHRVATR